MKNVLFVGPYRQSDGWGNASKEYVRALALTGCNLTTRPIYLNNQQTFAEFKEFEKFEANVSDSYDTIIQHCLPHQFRYYGGVKNIGLAFFESCDLNSTPWIEPINLMDEMWVCSAHERYTLKTSGVTTPIEIVLMPQDFSKYKKEYEPFKFGKEHDHEFKFYFVGEYVGRKDLNTLLLAFHREFHPDEPVRLVLKLNKVGMDSATLLQQVQYDIGNFKRNSGLRKKASLYKEELVITKFLPEDELYGLHNTCDCFVTASSAEAFCIPAFDAMMFGKTPIVNDNSSMAEFINYEIGGLVDSYLVPAISADRPLPFLYNGHDSWYQVDTIHLGGLMRKEYELKRSVEIGKDLKKCARKNNTSFTYESVASKMKELL